jgi:hypothetical protein
MQKEEGLVMIKKTSSEEYKTILQLNKNPSFLYERLKETNEVFFLKPYLLDDLEDVSVGYEFEFYINGHDESTRKYMFESLVKEMAEYSFHDIGINMDNVPSQKDYTKWTITIDESLEARPFGVEIITPKIPFSFSKYYLKKTFEAIEKYGGTDADCGFHIHMSIPKAIDPVKYLLFVESNTKILTWEQRGRYAKNIFSILHATKEDVFRRDGISLGKYWNINFVDMVKNYSHVEIRAMGGKDYHNIKDEIIAEAENFAEVLLIAGGELSFQKEYQSLFELYSKNNLGLNGISLSEIIKKAKFLHGEGYIDHLQEKVELFEETRIVTGEDDFFLTTPARNR